VGPCMGKEKYFHASMCADGDHALLVVMPRSLLHSASIILKILDAKHS
jgi:hypothetical protein